MYTDNKDAQLLIALLALPGVGRRTAAGVAESCQMTPGSSTDFSDLINEHASRRLASLTPEECSHAWEMANTVLSAAQDMDVAVLTPTSPQFPNQLGQIPDPPAILFAKGDVGCLNERCIAVIGAREASTVGIQQSTAVTEACVQSGFVVVSGLAIGIDTAAHRACMTAGGKTIAVLAHGLGHVFPPENQDLADDIAQDGGLLLSEYLPATPPIGPRFVERDRIQSGVSDGVILIESTASGGSMHTVRYAVDHRRALAAMTLQPATPEGNTIAIDAHDAQPLNGLADVNQFLAELKPPTSEPQSLWG
jgi:DNA processing protein